MTYKTILIDDEPLALQRLERLLAPFEFIEITAKASSGFEAVEKINELKPNLIFLDIQMPELTGFEVLEQIDESPFIIFSTAYDEYALKAFETNSIDYLLKLIEPRRLKTALEKLQRLTQEDIGQYKEQLQKLLAGYKAPSKKRIKVKIGSHIRLINIDDIYYFRAEDKYVAVHTFDESFLLNQSLNQLQADLPPDDFVRVHRSAIINLNYLKEIKKLHLGSYLARMKDKQETQVPVSRHSRVKLGLG